LAIYLCCLIAAAYSPRWIGVARFPDVDSFFAANVPECLEAVARGECVRWSGKFLKAKILGTLLVAETTVFFVFMVATATARVCLRCGAHP
jgi:hypothetical protein